jgi:hypothetical protein
LERIVAFGCNLLGIASPLGACVVVPLNVGLDGGAYEPRNRSVFLVGNFLQAREKIGRAMESCTGQLSHFVLLSMHNR